MYRVPGLSEHFLYFNDDCFVLNPIEKDYFFTKDGTPINGFHYINLNKRKHTQWGALFLNAYNAAYDADEKHGIYKPVDGMQLELWHHAKALTVSNCEECWSKLHDKFIDSITPFRSEKSINDYVFYLYDYFTGKCQPRNSDFNRNLHIGVNNGVDKRLCCINDDN